MTNFFGLGTPTPLTNVGVPATPPNTVGIPGGPSSITVSNGALLVTPATSGQGNDIAVRTSGQGPQSISRTFTVPAGQQTVTVRYRFVTSEVPGGYYGTEFNDYYSVMLRSQSAGKAAINSNSMNGLGLGAFDFATGALPWQTLVLPVNPGGDVVQLDATVANVADGQLDSVIEIDYLDSENASISGNLLDIDNNPLKYLSASGINPYFSGNTRINGTLTIKGNPTDSLQSLELDVVQNGAVVAVANLSSNAAAALLNKPFGASGLSIGTGQLLFELPNSEAGKVDTSQNGNVTLRVKGVTAQGTTVQQDMATVSLLTRFTGSNRYGQRDESLGGDDWLLPGVEAVITSVSGVDFNDFSNMNGGPFSPHSSHQKGVDVDGWFSGYNPTNAAGVSGTAAATAATMLSYLNDATLGPHIQLVFVAYKAQDGDPFYDAIKGVKLADGRLATSVIRPDSGHSTHFHWRFSPN